MWQGHQPVGPMQVPVPDPGMALLLSPSMGWEFPGAAAFVAVGGGVVVKMPFAVGVLWEYKVSVACRASMPGAALMLARLCLCRGACARMERLGRAPVTRTTIPAGRHVRVPAL